MKRAPSATGCRSRKPFIDTSGLPSVGRYLREWHGIDHRGGAEWQHAVCPACREGEMPFSFRHDGGGYRCSACGIHGRGALFLHAAVSGLPLQAAAAELRRGRPA
jgi:hypothetical protein